jgi:hypothetical protein
MTDITSLPTSTQDNSGSDGRRSPTPSTGAVQPGSMLRQGTRPVVLSCASWLSQGRPGASRFSQAASKNRHLIDEVPSNPDLAVAPSV